MFPPVMALVTYILLSAVIAGSQGQFDPRILGQTASKSLGLLFLEFLSIKLGCYLLGIGEEGAVVDLLAYEGYKFVGSVHVVPSDFSPKLTRLVPGSSSPSSPASSVPRVGPSGSSSSTSSSPTSSSSSVLTPRPCGFPLTKRATFPSNSFVPSDISSFRTQPCPHSTRSTTPRQRHPQSPTPSALAGSNSSSSSLPRRGSRCWCS